MFKTCDWEAFENYARNCKVGFYMVKDDVDGKRICVSAGRLVYDGLFNMQDEKSVKLYERIIQFCALQCYIPVEGSVSEEAMFT